jgi:hypothetical protein
MICPTCCGGGVECGPIGNSPLWWIFPCRECGGTGIASCCDAAGSAQPGANPGTGESEEEGGE